MTDTSLDLSGKLDSDREQVFRDVAEAAAGLGISFFIVGACARDLLLELHYGLSVQRATNDIDFGLHVTTWQEFEQLKTTLTEMGPYLPDRHQPQRLHSTTGMVLDVVPFGPIEDATTRGIAWPPDYAVVMSTLGFTEAYEYSLQVRLAADLEVRVSSLVGLTLMKLVAWDERREVKDAKDLKLLLVRYLQAGNAERLETGPNADLLDEEQFVSLELTGARLLGRDLALVMTGPSYQVVRKVLANPVSLAAQMAAETIDPDEAFAATLQLLEMLGQGIADVISLP